ncbi:hypothetical protein [Endozoicomonas sp. 8E]|uniref:hypothetical protein n=1 Tax=Endozoicomonas sp. 8E TaxID=3035692 RepID=UPI002939410B|nr:hypothetical protein [Endozoicomonas sp. 8E]WOG27557.1 hypothetical protein P6910_23915 [Endozoicomonas sp. 8E]
MKPKYAVYIILLLSFTYLHADEVEKQIIGTWLIRDNLPFNRYITYHPPCQLGEPALFNIRGCGECFSEDVLYGRYDLVVEMPILSGKAIAGSGVWFFPRDSQEKMILDVKSKDVDLDRLRVGKEILNPAGGLCLTRVVQVDANEFIYEECNPDSKELDRYKAVKVPDQSLEQIKQLPHLDDIRLIFLRPDGQSNLSEAGSSSAHR